jgi:hypothetical protein
MGLRDLIKAGAILAAAPVILAADAIARKIDGEPKPNKELKYGTDDPYDSCANTNSMNCEGCPGNR